MENVRGVDAFDKESRRESMLEVLKRARESEENDRRMWELVRKLDDDPEAHIDLSELPDWMREDFIGRIQSGSIEEEIEIWKPWWCPLGNYYLQEDDLCKNKVEVDQESIFSKDLEETSSFVLSVLNLPDKTNDFMHNYVLISIEIVFAWCYCLRKFNGPDGINNDPEGFLEALYQSCIPFNSPSVPPVPCITTFINGLYERIHKSDHLLVHIALMDTCKLSFNFKWLQRTMLEMYQLLKNVKESFESVKLKRIVFKMEKKILFFSHWQLRGSFEEIKEKEERFARIADTIKEKLFENESLTQLKAS